MQKSKSQSTNSFLERSSVQKAIKSVREELSLLCRDLISGKVVFNYGDKICTAFPTDFPRCLAEWSQSSSISFAIRNIVLSAFYSTETNQGGSGLISCLLWSGVATNKENKYNKKGYASLEEVERVLTSWVGSGLSLGITKKLVKLGAVGTPVSLREGSHSGTVISCVRGQEVMGSIDPLFDSRVPLDQTRNEFYIVAIDGTVESMGQIHSLLEKSNQQKLIILARGFLPDVSNTLAENWRTGKLAVIPFVVTNWGVENFLDLEKNGFECVSTETGGTIGAARLHNQLCATIFKNRIVYQSNGKKTKTDLSVSFGEDLGSLKGISIDRTKTLLALARFVARSGIVELNMGDRSLFVPRSSLDVAKRAEKSLEEILQNIGGVITSNK